LAGTYAIMAAISLCPTCLCSSPYKLLIPAVAQDPLTAVFGFGTVIGNLVVHVPVTILLLVAAVRDLARVGRPGAAAGPGPHPRRSGFGDAQARHDGRRPGAGGAHPRHAPDTARRPAGGVGGQVARQRAVRALAVRGIVAGSESGRVRRRYPFGDVATASC